jgi:hypothetical protein
MYRYHKSTYIYFLTIYNFRKIQIFLYFLLSIIAFNASSKVILENYKDTEEMTIKIEGEITKSEYSDFIKAYKQIKRNKQRLHLNAIQLNSPGGLLQQGKEIGWFIRHNELNTYLAPDARCSSSCVYILVGGIIRLAYGRVGVHRSTPANSTTDADLISERLDLLNFSISQYFKDMGMSEQLITATLIIPNWSIRYLTEDEKWNWGVLGIEPVHEELYFRRAARKLGISFDEFKERFQDQLENCRTQARVFENIYFDCVK